MKTSTLLRLANKRLWDGQGHGGYACNYFTDRFICLAIANAADKTHKRATSAVASALMLRISSSLDRCLTVEAWLVREGYATDEQIVDYKMMQDYRKRWVDELIAEYKNKGD